MNIALIGYGRMGHIIEEIAVARGHRIGLTVDVDNYNDLNSEKFKGIDVAIEFSSPESALRNVSACLNMKVLHSFTLQISVSGSICFSILMRSWQNR